MVGVVGVVLGVLLGRSIDLRPTELNPSFLRYNSHLRYNASGVHVTPVPQKRDVPQKRSETGRDHSVDLTPGLA